MSTGLDKLKEIGFVRAGIWHLEDEVLELRLGTYASNSEALYAFVCDTDVLYVGKTIKGLSKRMGQYRRPGPSQLTNLAVHGNLRIHLQQGHGVDVWMFVDPKPTKYGAFTLNLAAGLEDSIIAVLNPPWNGTNRRVAQLASIQ